MSKLVSSTGKATVKILETCIPKLVIKSDALTKMQIFIENCSEEVGWLGTAHKQNGYIVIDDVFLFDQEVHSTTTEITPEGLSKFAEELLMQEDGMEIWNNMKVWGHSHVNMSVSPSGQDDNQMITFSESGHDWFIRIIANKKGEIKVDLYEYELGIIYTDLPWKELASDEELVIMKRIEELQKILKKNSEDKIAALEPTIKEEIKSKVRKKTYPYQYGRQAYLGGTSLVTKTGTESNSTIKFDDYKDKGKAGTADAKKKQENVINKREDVHLFFSDNDLKDFADCYSIYQVKQMISTYGYEGVFSEDDVMEIWNFSRERERNRKSAIIHY